MMIPINQIITGHELAKFFDDVTSSKRFFAGALVKIKRVVATLTPRRASVVANSSMEKH